MPRVEDETMKPGDFPPPTRDGPARLYDVPLVIELGRLRRKQAKRLKRGEGPLTVQIQAAVDRRRAELGVDNAAEIVPVVLLYRREEPDFVVIAPRNTRPAE